MVQCLRIHLPMQGAGVQSLVLEGFTCHGAAKPVPMATEPALPRACEPQLLSLCACNYLEGRGTLHPCLGTREATAVRSLRSPQLEKTQIVEKRPSVSRK